MSRRRVSDLRDMTNLIFERILRENNEEPEVLESLQTFRPPQPAAVRRRRTRNFTLKVSVLRQYIRTYRSSNDVVQTCRVLVSQDMSAEELQRTLRSSVPHIPAHFDLCRVNGRREVLPLPTQGPAELRMVLQRSNLYIRPQGTEEPRGDTALSATATVSQPTTSTSATASQPTTSTSATASQPTSSTTSTSATASQPTSSTTSTSAMASSEPMAPTEIISSDPFQVSDGVDGEDEEAVMLASPARSPASNDERDLQTLLEDFQSSFVDKSNTVPVVVTRRRVLQSACLALKRSYFEWHKEPRVEFLNEMGDDYGGPRREFFRLLIREIQTMDIWEGNTENVFFAYNLGALASNKFYTAGKLTAWSLAHNGPGPRSLNRDLFRLMCGETPELTSTDISPILGEHGEKFAELKRCTLDRDIHHVKEVLADWVADCGVPTVYTATAEDLTVILQQVTAHFCFHRVSSMVRQYQNGINSCGAMWTLISQNCQQFLKVFTNTGGKLTRSQIRRLFKPEMSEERTRRRDEEEDTLYWWDQWLVDIEQGNAECVTFEDLMVFVTGADHVPSLGFPKDPSIEFYSQEHGVRRLPYASTCSLTLNLPRGVDQEGVLEGMMVEAIKGSLGFLKV